MKRKLSVLLAFVITTSLVFSMAGGISMATASPAYAQALATCRQEVVGHAEAGAMEVRCRRAVVFYGAGACVGKCVANPKLPNKTMEDLRSIELMQVVSWVYIRTLNEAREPVDVWTTTCFSKNIVDDVAHGSIFRYNTHTDDWVPVGYTWWHESGDLCANYYGEVSLALIGWAP